MPSDRESTKKFVETWHLNVAERRSLEGKALAGSLLVEAITAAVREHGWYPRDWRPDHDFDGGLVELVPPEGCRIHWKVEVGASRFALDEVQEFDSLSAGVRAYGLRFFRADFDGIAIDWAK